MQIFIWKISCIYNFFSLFGFPIAFPKQFFFVLFFHSWPLPVLPNGLKNWYFLLATVIIFLAIFIVIILPSDTASSRLLLTSSNICFTTFISSLVFATSLLAIKTNSQKPLVMIHFSLTTLVFLSCLVTSQEDVGCFFLPWRVGEGVGGFLSLRGVIKGLAVSIHLKENLSAVNINCLLMTYRFKNKQKVQLQ